jgi:hypothetical protein
VSICVPFYFSGGNAYVCHQKEKNRTVYVLGLIALWLLSALSNGICADCSSLNSIETEVHASFRLSEAS